MTLNVLLALASASIFGLIAVVALAKWLGGALRRLADGVAALSVASQTTPASSRDVLDRVLRLDIEVKAVGDDLAQFRESVKRWQGRVNRQSARDAQEVVTDDDPEKMGQTELLAAGGAMRAPAGNAKPGQRPRLLPRLRTHSGR